MATFEDLKKLGRACWGSRAWAMRQHLKHCWREILGLVILVAAPLWILAGLKAIGLGLAVLLWGQFVRYLWRRIRHGEARVPSSREGPFWEHDHPIREREEDRFGLDGTAEEVEKVLTNPGMCRNGVFVQGALGGGKTSLLNLVRRRLEERTEKDVLVVSVSMWSFEKLEAAVVGVLRRVVDALPCHLCGLATRGIPEQYLELVSGHAGPWGKFLRWVFSPPSFDEILKRIDGVLSLHGRHMVVWIEDLERADKNLHGASPLFAMFHLLNDCENIQFVMAAQRIPPALPDPSRVFQSRFAIPTLPPQTVSLGIQEWEELLREDIEARGLIYVEGADRLPSLGQNARSAAENADDVASASRVFGKKEGAPQSVQPSVAIADLLRTPRTLKTALRQATNHWDRVRGEVLPHEVLVYSGLEVVAPAVLDIIDRRLQRLRQTRWTAGEQDEVRKAIFEEISKIADLKEEPRTLTAVYSLVLCLSPNLGNSNTRLVQSIGASRPLFSEDRDDPWWKLRWGRSIAEENRDQPLLRAILDANAGQRNEFVRFWSEGRRRRRMAPFLSLFDWQQLVDLVNAIGEDALRRDVDWSGYDVTLQDPLGFVPLLRGFLNPGGEARPPLKETLQGIGGLAIAFMKRSPALSESLEFAIACALKDQSDEVQAEILDPLRQGMLRGFEDLLDQGDMARLFAGGVAEETARFLLLGPPIEGRPRGEGWETGLAKLLDRALEVPEILGAQVVAALVDWGGVSQSAPNASRPMESRIEILDGARLLQLVRAIEEGASKPSPTTRKRLEALRRFMEGGTGREGTSNAALG